MRERIACVFGSKQLSTLLEIEEIDEVDPQILEYYGLDNKTFDLNRFKLEGFISQPNSGRSCSDRQFFFINSRPCEPIKASNFPIQDFYFLYPLEINSL